MRKTDERFDDFVQKPSEHRNAEDDGRALRWLCMMMMHASRTASPTFENTAKRLSKMLHASRTASLCFRKHSEALWSLCCGKLVETTAERSDFFWKTDERFDHFADMSEASLIRRQPTDRFDPKKTSKRVRRTSASNHFAYACCGACVVGEQPLKRQPIAPPDRQPLFFYGPKAVVKLK